jgi:hypothetical protein
MKKLLFFISLVMAAVLFLICQAEAKDCSWGPSTGGPEGYKIYSTDSDNVTMGKVLMPAEYEENATAIYYRDFDEKLNLVAGETYTMWVTAWNQYGESGPSNTIEYTREEYTPESTEWPDIVNITVPSGFQITITAE